MSEIDGTSSAHLRGKYAIVGVGETEYTRGSGVTTRALGTTAVRNAVQDAGLSMADVDGMMSYSGNDSTMSPVIAGELGIRLNFHMDVIGGGSSIEALIGIAMGVIEAGMCKTVVIFRAMNGFSQVRIGGTGRGSAGLSGASLFSRGIGLSSAGQMFAQSFMRHMYDYGTTPEQVAHVKVIHSEHASNNPKAYYKQRVTVDDVLGSRMICKPLHLLDCCVETDNGVAIVVTSIDRARDCKHPPAVIQGVVGRCCKPRADMHYQSGPISTVAGHWGKEILWKNAGVGPEDIDVTGAYDAFTFTTMLQLEDYGFCKKGEGGDYVSNGTTRLGGKRPNNTSGGHLCEGYTHGVNMVIENVRQLRGEIDDSCPIGPDGTRQHTHDYSEGGCRQVKDVELTANLGWGTPGIGSALVMGRQ
ncbi:MAG: thiolase [Gammaproteobacteria bacterium]|nr:thiolase [Gammaproteobacteria bacterium]|tara:strand:+ start:15 stop:1259 length:1245 start_codon:yes stop_codon:yes gene_type:complete